MKLNEKLYSILNNQIVGGSFVFVKGENEFKYNYGYSSLSEMKLVEDDTIYRIASISKLIIGIAALKLVEDKLLDLDEDISNILGFKVRNPRYPDVPITTRMLMLHTSSITDGGDDVEGGYNGVNGQHSFVKLEDLLANQESKYFTEKTFSNYYPGEKYIYSNFGPGIIACIIEKCRNKLFSEFVEDVFFKPLYMRASFKANKILIKDKISDTFTGFATNKKAKDFIDSTYPDFSLGNNFRGPAGGLFVSMQDLSKIMIALMNDGFYKDVNILKKESVDVLLTINFLARRHYNDQNITLNGITGGAYGICSVMYFCKEKKTGVCFIANGGNYKPAPSGLNNVQESIISILLNEL